MDLRGLLLQLLQFGKPRLSHDGDGWHCCVEMFVAHRGAQFTIRSEFSLPSPEDAATQCLQRVADTLGSVRALPTLSVAP